MEFSPNVKTFSPNVQDNSPKDSHAFDMKNDAFPDFHEIVHNA